jgi:hypothetical protein
LNLLKDYGHLKRAIREPDQAPIAGGQQCVAVLLSHNRPQNIPLLVEAALQNSFVKKIIVSNSNRAVRMQDWIQVRDSRLMLVDEANPTRPGYRFVLAQAEVGDYFLSIDDDIFLTPCQWRGFFECLVRDPAVPHGLTGNYYRPGEKSSNGSPFHHVTETDTEVDVLIGAYAFTRQHLACLFQLSEYLGLGDLTHLANGEDLLLSLAGLGRPKIHDLGHIFCCASASLEGVALWRTLDDFWDERVRLFERAKAARKEVAG